jgi:hypothetical protein
MKFEQGIHKSLENRDRGFTLSSQRPDAKKSMKSLRFDSSEDDESDYGSELSEEEME